MTGRAEVYRLRQLLNNTFDRGTKVGDDLEVQSDFARYLCVLVSGFLEKAVVELVLEHTRRTASPTIQSYVEFSMRRFTNAKAQRLQELLGAFDPEWGESLEKFLVDERKDALESIVTLRNRISHGQSVGVTFVRVKQYYEHILCVVDHVANLCEPVE